MRKIIVAAVLALILVASAAVPAFASSDTVTVTATPAFISIANTPGTWAINDVAEAGGKTIVPDTIYYSNPVGDTTIPSDPVVDGECRFSVTNTSSVATNIVVNFPDHTGGDASTNSDLGTNDTTSFGAYSYTSYGTFNYSTDKVIAKNAASVNLISSLPATTNFKWGLAYESQSNAWTSGTAMQSTVTITATAS